MANRWIFPTISVVAISGLILGHEWWSLLIIALMLLRVFKLHQVQILWWSLVISVLFIGYFVSFTNQNKQGQQAISQYQDKQITIVSKVWVDDLYFDGNQIKYVAEITPQQKILVNVVLPSQAAKVNLQKTTGAVKITSSGQIGLINSATNSGQFDAHNYYQLQQINGQLTKGTIQKFVAIKDNSLMASIHDLRQKVIKYFEQLPKYLRFYGETLILGYVRPDFYQDNQGIKELGLLHLFSISGFQVTMFIMLGTKLLRLLGLPKEIIAIVLLILLPLYYIFSGSIPSLIRAILLGMISQLLVLTHRRITKLDGWSWSLLGGLVFEPGILQMLGGQLSYLLALALIFTENLKFWQQIIMMNIVTLPLLLYTTYQWHLIAILANFIFIPIFTFMVVPITVVGVLTHYFLPPLASGINTLISMLNQIITELSNLPGNIIFGQITWVSVVLLTVITFYLMQKIANWRGWTVLVGLYLISWLSLQLPLHGEVTFVDIGQGDSILIQTPFKREVTLIDTGGRLAFGPQQKWQQRIKQSKSNAELFLLPYLKQRGISRINQIILTHADADHSGDLPVVLKNMTVDKVYVGNGLENKQNYQALAQKYNTIFQPLRAGDVITNGQLKVLWPQKKSRGKNEDSIVTTGQYGKLRFIFMGDLNQTNELKIVAMRHDLRTDVIKLGHHGSKTSSAPKFLQAIKPKIAIISAGRNNRYHHPHAETLKTLADNKISYFSTAQDGMIKYEWSLFGDGWWKMKK